MVRSLYSGVAGMTTHQVKMDVIGNNISNVSTYGYKTGRATFRDVYYQTQNGASGATPFRGGTNPREVGYGTQVSSIDVNHSQSIMSMTGFGLDCSIGGEGYFQVQDRDGNIFYTKAGMLDFDGEGNLVDMNGNFVLGTPTGRGPVGTQLPGSHIIRIDLPYLNAQGASFSDSIDENLITLESTNSTKLANIPFAFTSVTDLPIGQDVRAVVASDSVTIQFSATAEFADIDDLNTKINSAIRAGNNGADLPGGEYVLSFENDPFLLQTDPAAPAIHVSLTGAQLVRGNFGVDIGTGVIQADADPGNADYANFFSVASTGDRFLDGVAGYDDTTGAVETIDDATILFNYGASATDPANNVYKLSITVPGGVPVYYAELTPDQMKSSGSVMLRRFDGALNGVPLPESDSITVKFPTLSRLLTNNAIIADDPDTVADEFTSRLGNGAGAQTIQLTPSVASRDVGLSQTIFALKGGTEGGPQTANDLTAINLTKDGVIYAMHSILGEIELGRIDTATFANPAGLSQVGNTYFAESANSGAPRVGIPGTEGSGGLIPGALETSNVDLSHEFTDMITTQRGFQANSRIITVSDTMLEELLNLKR
ncbi:MAG: flagellar hook-basal body complex protein [Oscillospiraceae bacterium]|nr:flagellar hook-basal body complex protein [Oscillospiraceae bacterium]